MMKAKKNQKYNLEAKRILFLQFGFIVSFLLVLTAFEYKVPMQEPKHVEWEELGEIDELISINLSSIKNFVTVCTDFE